MQGMQPVTRLALFGQRYAGNRGHFAYDSEESITAQNGIRRRSIRMCWCAAYICVLEAGQVMGREGGRAMRDRAARLGGSRHIALWRLALRSDTCECVGGDILRL